MAKNSDHKLIFIPVSLRRAVGPDVTSIMQRVRLVLVLAQLRLHRPTIWPQVPFTHHESISDNDTAHMLA